ncbi:hypothetical protein MPER_09104, partial [Moniliophthora perniciosa FA553]
KEHLQPYNSEYDVIGAGDIPVTNGEKVRMMSVEEVKKFIGLFATAASNAVHRAGFDGVEIHGANGHFVNQFIEDVSNNRTDEYGESVENRRAEDIPEVESLESRLGLHPTLAYLHVTEPRVSSIGDQEVLEGESNDFIRRIWSPRPLIFAGGYKRQDALESAQEEGMLIAFGRHFISNPDLPIRLEKDLPLTKYDRSKFYIVGDTSGQGYTDYRFA